MKTPLLKAVKSYWDGRAALTNFFLGGLHTNEVPETDEDGNPPALPYCYVESPRTTFLWTMSSMYVEEAILEFTLFAVGAKSATDGLLLIQNNFDWVPQLSFDDGDSSIVAMTPVRTELVSEPLRYKDGSLLFRAQASYEAWVHRTYDGPPKGLPH